MVLEYVKSIGNAAEACRDLDIPNSSFYNWKKAYDKEGKEVFLRKKPIPKSHPKKIKQSVIDKIVYLRETYQLGSWIIEFYLERYHNIHIISEKFRMYRLYLHQDHELTKEVFFL